MKNIYPLKTAKRKFNRLTSLLAELGDHPVCLFCGCSEPMLLRPMTPELFARHRRFFEEHHVFGWMIDGVTTLALCFNCHALVTEGLLQAGIAMKREPDPIKFSQAVFRTQAVHFQMLGDAYWRFANFLEEENPMIKKPSEKISRGVVGEVLAPSSLPPALAALSQEWEKLTYEERVADAKQRPLAECVQILQALGGTFKNAIHLVRQFGPLLEVCRDELSQPGRRVPIEGKPTWTEFIPAAFGFSARRMQQLLADGKEPPELGSPATQREKTKRGSDSSDDGQREQVAALALKLARSVVERGLADQFPEAEAILNIFETKRKGRPLTAGGSTESHAVPIAQDSNEALSPATPGRADNAAEQPLVESKFQLLPDCYVCGTGINFCAVHEPEHKRLMAERGLDDVDAADLLKERYATRVRELSKVA